MSYKYSLSCLGGAFDHLHAGHKHFIDNAFSASQKVIIGLSTSSLLEKKLFKESLEDYETRKASLISYLTKKGYLERTEIFPLDDIYGESITNASLEAIFVTETTSENAEKINRKRQEKTFPPLAIIVVPRLTSSDGNIISSTRIRKGEIDREGNSYLKLFENNLILPESLREKLRIPIGEVLKEELIQKSAAGFIIAVGDIIISELIKHDITPNVCVFDYKSRREAISKDVENLIPKAEIETENNAGTINKAAVSVLSGAIQKAMNGENQSIKILGEEDLLTLPAILLAPLASRVLYGMPGTGAIAAEVSESSKQEAKALIKQFEVSKRKR